MNFYCQVDLSKNLAKQDSRLLISCRYKLTLWYFAFGILRRVCYYLMLFFFARINILLCYRKEIFKSPDRLSLYKKKKLEERDAKCSAIFRKRFISATKKFIASKSHLLCKNIYLTSEEKLPENFPSKKKRLNSTSHF